MKADYAGNQDDTDENQGALPAREAVLAVSALGAAFPAPAGFRGNAVLAGTSACSCARAGSRTGIRACSGPLRLCGTRPEPVLPVDFLACFGVLVFDDLIYNENLSICRK